MSKKLSFWAVVVLFSALAASAAVAPGENLILNGNFEAEQLEFPQFWEQGSKSMVSYNPTGGPDSSPAIIFSNPEQLKGVATVRQFGLRLVAGETYKMSAWVKTNGFESGHCGVIAHNTGWYSSQGVVKFPETTDGWQLLENTFEAASSSDNSYGAALFAQHFKGEIHFAKVKLEAISPGALEGSSASPILVEQNKVRLVAWAPLLNAIPMDNPQLTFHFFGRPGQNQEIGQFDCVYTLDGKEFQKSPLQPKLNHLDLKGVAAGDHTLEYAVVQRDNGEKVFALTHAITLVNVPKIDASSHRRLNNFVTEVLSQDLAAQAGAQSFSFDNPKNGWVFIAVQNVGATADLAVDIADLGTIITADTDRAEAFRHLPMGRHTITVKGVAAGGKLVVRAITEIFNYPACANSQVPQNGKYDWDFHVKHIFPAVTTLNGGFVPDAKVPELKKLGLLWLANLGTTNPKDVEDLVERLQKSPGMNDPKYDGLTCDEQFFAQPNISIYTDALRAYPNPNNRLIYTWIVGKPGLRGIHNDFISASLNVSRSRGRLIYEAYCHSLPNEKEAQDYLHTRLVETIDSFVEYYPGAAAGSGILFGNFNQIPIISLDVNPEVDYKYYLDMQVNMVANHPSFKGLGTTGYWGSYYDDEELYRWSFQIMRHYCVEGNASMLSEKYGYKYNPGCLRNCDFVQDLSGWAVQAAAEGSLVKSSFAGYGKSSQGRWGGGLGTGDSFCLFKRQDGKPNVITQQATGLTPGKVYTLQFVTADYQDMLTKRFNPRRHGIVATLGAGAELIPEKSYVFVDKRNGGRKKDDGLARINLHHIRFRATADSFTVTFSDVDAAPGEELALNYIMMKPYFE